MSQAEHSGERQFASKDAERAWIITHKVDEITSTMQPEGESVSLKPITFDEVNKKDGLTAIFTAGTVVGTGTEALLVPDRTLEILNKLGITYKTV